MPAQNLSGESYEDKLKMLKEEIDVNKVMLSTLNLLVNQLEINKIKVEKSLCNNILPVKALEQELFQVFMNIILNAQDAMKGGGILKITTEVKEKQIYIIFQDNGAGISKKDIEQMEEDIINDVEKAVDFARKSPEPDLKVFLEEVKQI